MDDFATLGIQIHTGDVAKARDELGRFVKAGGQAEKANDVGNSGERRGRKVGAGARTSDKAMEGLATKAFSNVAEPNTRSEGPVCSARQPLGRHAVDERFESETDRDDDDRSLHSDRKIGSDVLSPDQPFGLIDQSARTRHPSLLRLLARNREQAN